MKHAPDSDTAVHVQRTLLQSRLNGLKARLDGCSDFAQQKLNLSISALEQELTQLDQIGIARQRSDTVSRPSLANVIDELSSKALATDTSDTWEDQFSKIEQSYLRDDADKNSKENPLAIPIVPPGLKRVKQKREDAYLEGLLDSVWRTRPENPGPINPHMLAIKTLRLMQELSPEYFKHLVNYIDTTIWLDEL